MEPNFQPVVTTSSHKKTGSTFVLIMGVILIALLVSYFSKVVGEKKYTKDNVSVVKTDLSVAKGSDRLPLGFPEGLYVELDGITDSFVMDYPDKGVKITSVIFTTSKTTKELMQLYTDYLLNEKYAVQGGQNDEKLIDLSGEKEKAKISFVINLQGEKPSVQISYLER